MAHEKASVVVKLAELIICKARTNFVLQQGMSNMLETGPGRMFVIPGAQGSVVGEVGARRSLG